MILRWLQLSYCGFATCKRISVSKYFFCSFFRVKKLASISFLSFFSRPHAMSQNLKHLVGSDVISFLYTASHHGNAAATKQYRSSDLREKNIFLHVQSET